MVLVNALNIVDLEKAVIKELENSILIIEFKKGAVIELDDAIEINRVCYALARENNSFFISIYDTTKMTTAHPEARDYFAKDPLVKDIRLGEAIVLNNLAIRMLARFYVRFTNSKKPARIFSDMLDAVLWAQELVVKLSMKEGA